MLKNMCKNKLIQEAAAAYLLVVQLFSLRLFNFDNLSSQLFNEATERKLESELSAVKIFTRTTRGEGKDKQKGRKSHARSSFFDI
jgi:hypothetical protein